jgi:hypothetical protein
MGISLPMLHRAFAWVVISSLGDLGMDDRAKISCLRTFRKPSLGQICFQEFGRIIRFHSDVKGSPDRSIRELDLNNLPERNRNSYLIEDVLLCRLGISNS